MIFRSSVLSCVYRSKVKIGQRNRKPAVIGHLGLYLSHNQPTAGPRNEGRVKDRKIYPASSEFHPKASWVWSGRTIWSSAKMVPMVRKAIKATQSRREVSSRKIAGIFVLQPELAEWFSTSHPWSCTLAPVRFFSGSFCWIWSLPSSLGCVSPNVAAAFSTTSRRKTISTPISANVSPTTAL